MLDLKFIREHPELVKKAVENKNEKVDIDRILNLDQDKRKLQFDFDNLRAHQNKVSKEIPKLKKASGDTSKIIREMSEISSRIKELSAALHQTSELLESELLKIPNLPDPDVPLGNESQNRLIKTGGTKKVFDFEPVDHLALSETNKLLDFQRSAKLSGSGFFAYTGLGAMLERALINFMLDFHITKHGYQELFLPVLVNRKAMIGTGQLPKLEEDMYRIEEDDLFLIPTSEVSLTNFYAGEILNLKDLPRKLVSYSPCFRREAGSYGKETKGLQRMHQFNKVEMVRIVEPENSYRALEEMLVDAEDILEALGLHYRILTLATGDLSFASAKTYDIEVWAPGTGKYLEVSSISNFKDFQARRASLRYRDRNEKVNFVHTLNGSGLATPRTMIALLETYQNQDGSLDLLTCLKSYIQADL